MVWYILAVPNQPNLTVLYHNDSVATHNDSVDSGIVHLG